MTEEIILKENLFAALPQELKTDLKAAILQARTLKTDAVIVLDDDPTGTQTVYDTPVLTEWSQEVIEAEFKRGTPLFYILTNSRSLVESEAEKLAEEIGINIEMAAKELDKRYLVISRSDSTLRGHYPAEVDALVRCLQIKDGVSFIIPAFFEGGRYTVHDIHYVRDGEQLVPAAQTPFAKDKVFGYTKSNLRHWVIEKTRGAVSTQQIKSISLENLRTLSRAALLVKINSFQSGEICIVNAVSYQDLENLALTILQSNIQPIFRTAASFVAALAARPQKALLIAKDLDLSENKGGLIIVGSYVPMTTEQLSHLQTNSSIISIELNVGKLLEDEIRLPSETAKIIDRHLTAGQHVILHTSRKLVSSNTASENLQIGKKISDYLVKTVSNLNVQPKYILSKGGITSSVVATEGLHARRAMVLGQILAGVPVWQLGAESKFPSLPYIVFPGNVGSADSLTEVVHKLDFH